MVSRPSQRRFLPGLALILVPLLAPQAHADVPEPNISNVPSGLLLAPDGGLEYRVLVNSQGGPMVGATVEILFLPAEPLISWCSGQQHPSIQATTDGEGVASFHLYGGGCVDSERYGDVIYRVYADGVPLAEASQVAPGAVVSPDAVNMHGKLPTDPGYTADGGAFVTLSDAVFHTKPIVTTAFDRCTDFNSDDVVNVSDAVVVTSYIITAAACTP